MLLSLLIFYCEAQTDCPAEVAEHYCFDATCGLKLSETAITNNLNCECTKSHMGYDFTDCNPNTNTLSVFYFWKPPATCRAGSVILKTPVQGISCDATCAPGQRLAVDSSGVCEACAAGQYSLGGGISFDPPWNYLPPQFAADCSTKTHIACNTWRALGDFMDSGENRDSHNSQNALVLNIELVRDGMVTFQFKYDAEETFDIFRLYDNGLPVFEQKTNVLDWSMQNATLNAGYHELRWVFSKDSSISKGADKAFVRAIQILGMRVFDAECLLCPPGRFSVDQGKSACDACPANSHSSSYGSHQCDACHPWEKSFPGAAECSPRLPCTEADYFESRGPCVNSYQNVTTQWILPQKCESSRSEQGAEIDVGTGANLTGFIKTKYVSFLQPFPDVPSVVNLSAVEPWWAQNLDKFVLSYSALTESGFQLTVTRVNVTDNSTSGWGEDLYVRWYAYSSSGTELPPPRLEPCPVITCPPGQQKLLNSNKGMCAYCPPGMASLQGESCRPCSAGEGATEFVTHVDLSSVATTCIGDCGTEGWRKTDAFIDSGVGHGQGANSYFTVDVPRALSSITLEYSLSCSSQSAFLDLRADDLVVARLWCGGCSNATIKTLFPIPEGLLGDSSTVQVKVNFHQQASASYVHSCSGAKLYHMQLAGPSGAIADPPESPSSGASKCAMCTAGYYSSAALCLACPAGSVSSSGGQTACMQCEQGLFAYRSALDHCDRCGSGTSPSPDRSACTGPCGATFGELTYDTSPLFGSAPAWRRRSSSGLTYIYAPCDSAVVPSACLALRDNEWTAVGDNVSTASSPIHVCVMKTDASGDWHINGGSITSWLPLDSRAANTSEFRGITVSVTGGARVTCITPSGGQGLQALQSTLHLVCDQGAGIGTLQDVTPSMAGPGQVPCNTTMIWKSLYACPLCHTQDYSYYDGACLADSTAQRTYFWANPKTCSQGAPLPPPQVVSCVPSLVPEGSAVLSKGTIAGIVLVSVLVVSGSIGAILYLIKKQKTLADDNMRLRHYAQLEGNGPVPDVVNLHQI